MSKRLQKRSIDDYLRQLVLIRQDREPLASLQVILNFFFVDFSKKMGRSGNGERNIFNGGWP